MVNATMLSFVDLFDVKESHGLSPFCRSIDTVEELVEAVKDFSPSKLSTETGNASDVDSDNDDDSDANETDNESSDNIHETNIIDKKIKRMVNSLQNTSKESRIGACYEPEESTEELEDDNSFSTTMESFFEERINKKEDKFKSLEQQWFSANATNENKLGRHLDAGGEEDVYIEHDSFVKLKCKQGMKECTK
eukprot:13788959-Ditylum_brightwellii.AAC.1